MRAKIILGAYAVGLIILAVITVLSYGGSSEPTEVESYVTDYESFFDSAKDKVIDLHITMEEDAWTDMLVNAYSRQFYSANIKIDGRTYNSTGLRVKSNMLSSNPQSQTRYSFKLKFDKFIGEQTFYGLDELNLINQFGDPSFMREYLMLEAMHNAGIPAPLAVYVNLYVNGQLHGLYLGVESIDDSFLTRNFGDTTGNLYGAEKDASLFTDMYYEALSHKKGSDIENTELKYMIKILSNMQFGKGEIETVLDVDGVLKYIAANTVFGNYGSYLGKNAQDFYLYQNPTGGVFSIIPSDVYTAFGAYKNDYGKSVDVPTARPLLDADFTNRPLVGKLLAIEEYKTQYTEYIDEFTEYLKNVESRIGELDAIISPYVEADPTKFYTTEHYKANITGTGNMSILTYAQKRLEFLNK